MTECGWSVHPHPSFPESLGLVVAVMNLPSPACRLWQAATSFAVMLLLSIFVAIVAVPLTAAAQSQPTAGTTAPSAADLRALTARLENKDQRDQLLADLRALTQIMEKKAPNDGGFLITNHITGWLAEHFSALSNEIMTIASTVGDLPAAKSWLSQQMGHSDLIDRWFLLFGSIALILATSTLTKWIARRLLRQVRTRIKEMNYKGRLWRFIPPIIYIGIELLPVLAMTTVGYIVLSSSHLGGLSVRVATLTILNATIVASGLLAIFKIILIPPTEQLRITNLTQDLSSDVYIWARRLIYASVYGWFIPRTFYVNGLPTPTYTGLLKLFALIVVGILIAAILHFRHYVADAIRTHSAMTHTSEKLSMIKRLRNNFSDHWHLVSIIYISIAYVFLVIDIREGFYYIAKSTIYSILFLVFVRYFLIFVDFLFNREVHLSRKFSNMLPLLENHINSYLPWAHLIIRWITIIISVLFFMRLWDIDLFPLLLSSTGRYVVGSFINVIVTIIIFCAIWEIITSLIERALINSIEDGVEIQRSARARTILPLLRNALFLTMLAFSGLIILSEIGVNIAPLLAGAGVIGLAVGFGSQSLVKDVITGLFILLEDTITVGDVVEVGGKHKGVVEALSIRTIRLRDADGGLHVIPFSEVQTILNLTKDFGFAVIDAYVDYSANPERVIEALESVGHTIQMDERFTASVLEPVEVLGIEQFQDQAMIVRARIKTRPGKQWTIAREFRKLMKEKFEELGIPNPLPQRMMLVPGDVSGTQTALPKTKDKREAR